jgi:DNA-binding response OmpR family regulator
MVNQILVVEDNREMRTFCELLLSSEGYEVATAEDGIQAIQSVRQERPDLILLDLCLPHMSGWEVMKGLQTLAAQVEIPVVIMSALSSTDFGPAAWAMGCTMYLQKPFDADDLLLVVNRVLRPRGRCATA